MGKSVRKNNSGSNKKHISSNQSRQSARPAGSVSRPDRPSSPSRPSRPAGARPQPKAAEKRPPLSAEQRRKTNRAYNQATVHRSVKGRKRGSRGGNYIMYYILAAIIIVIVLIILSNTVLFNCTSIEVEGNSRYSAEQIISHSGLKLGENLLHIDSKAAEQSVYSALAYIDMTEVKRVFPTKIKIVVKEAEKWYQVSQNGVAASVSRMGRIVELGEDGSLPLIVGYDPAELTAGVMISSNDSGKTPIPALILDKAEQYGIADITRVDLTDRFDISIDCGSDITLELGGIAEIDSKLAVAAETMKKEKSNVVINLHTPSTIFVQDKVDGQAQQVLPDLSGTAEAASGEGTAEGTSEEAAPEE